VPKSQPELTRAAMNDAHHVDQALREISRRLLGKRDDTKELEERLDPSAPGQAEAWALTTQYLSKRMQVSATDCPGREPDMSPAAAAAFRAVLAEVGSLAISALVGGSEQQWMRLRELATQRSNADSSSDKARVEAATKMITNHHHLLRDVTNPVPKSQPELTRAAMNDAHHVDQALREISRRLLGKRDDTKELEERLDPSAPGQAEAWALTTQYLSKRMQVSATDCPGREPDMSPAAAAAFRAVLAKVGGPALEAWAAAESA